MALRLFVEREWPKTEIAKRLLMRKALISSIKAFLIKQKLTKTPDPPVYLHCYLFR